MSHPVQQNELKSEATGRSESGSLPDLLRPNFFAGQLLTSDDLSCLEKWVSARLSLRRQDAGWGVVCGMDVACDEKAPLEIVVRPGHAIDPAGRDLVLRQEIKASLEKYCPNTGCTDATGARCAEPAEPGEPFRIGSLTIPAKRIRVLDITAHFYEKGTDPRPVLPAARSSSGTCKDSRIIESVSLRATPAETRKETKASNSGGTVVENDSCFDVLNLFQSNKKLETLWKWKPGQPLPEIEGRFVASQLRGWMAGKVGKGQLPFVSRLVDQIENAKTAFPWIVAEALFWIIQSCRQRAVGCEPCADPAQGVPLARVWLETSEDRCRILFINTGEGHRRVASPSFLTNSGDIDLLSFIGKHWQNFSTALRWYGLNASEERVRLPADLGGVGSIFQWDDAPSPLLAKVARDQEVVALVSRIPSWDGQLIGFQDRSAASPEFPFRINNITVIDPANTALTPPVTNILGDRPVPKGGQIRLAIEVAREDWQPNVEPLATATTWKLSVYENLSGSKSERCNGTVTNNVTLNQTLFTPSFEVNSNESSPQIVLLASNDHGSAWNSFEMPWKVTPPGPSMDVNATLPLASQVFAPGEKTKVTLTMKNPSLYPVSGNYAVGTGSKTPFDCKPNETKKPEIEWELPGTGNNATLAITFSDVKNQFLNPIEIKPLDLSVKLIKVKYLLKKDVDTFKLTVKAEEKLTVRSIRVQCEVKSPAGINETHTTLPSAPVQDVPFNTGELKDFLFKQSKETLPGELDSLDVFVEINEEGGQRLPMNLKVPVTQ